MLKYALMILFLPSISIQCNKFLYWNTYLIIPQRKNTKTELYHFIGKDIAYFHALFWPAMLEGSGLKKPDAIFCHGFLTIDGEKMSKSRGTFILAKTYYETLDPEYLRFYFAAKLGTGIDDIDLNLEDFLLRTNSDLIGKYIYQ